MGTPSERIAAELRGRIVRGELATGERLPSTRQIAHRWGVAIATATRALGLLRAEGLVRAVRGVGTVVAARAAPRGPSDEALTGERIVAVAVAVADAEGLAAVSMRRLAHDLGASPMALYRHVADKDDLLVRMLDAAMGEWRPPADPPAGWRPRLELAARGLWTAFRRHPWLAHALSVTRPQPIPAGMAYSEWMLASLDGHGLGRSEMFDLHLTLMNYVRGTAMSLEPEAAAEAATGLTGDEWIRMHEPGLLAIVESDGLPQLGRMFAHDYVLDVDVLFETGLRLLLDGLSLRLGG